MKRSRLNHSIDGERADACNCRCFVDGHQPNFIAARPTKGKQAPPLPYQDLAFSLEGDLCAKQTGLIDSADEGYDIDSLTCRNNRV